MSLRCIVSFVLCSSALYAGDPSPRSLTFEDRVAAQAAIERVYYAHQIGATRPFDEAMPRAALENKVRRYLDQSVALEAFWKTPVTDEMLDRELERIARGTRMPDRLLELYAALGDDSFLIKECLARAVLVDRLARNFYAFDPTLHIDARRQAEELHRRLVAGELSATASHPNRTVVEYDEKEAEDAHLPDSVGDVSPLEEAREAFTFRAILGEANQHTRIASYVVPKMSWDEWWATASIALPAAPPATAASDDGFLPQSPGGAPCVAAESWDTGIMDHLPDPRAGHTAVWTGSLMLVWGGGQFPYLDTGGRYDPSTDSWTPMSSTGAPSARYTHAAVWTGSRMIVWGGYGADGFVNTGGSYDPATDGWTTTATTGAPSARQGHTAVWTGSRMVIWGGSYLLERLDTGGSYDPSADSWTTTSTTAAPSARDGHTAVWSGSLMLVWGGNDGHPLNTGGRYNPATDSWTAMSTTGAPTARSGHTAVWTGSVMVIWGGNVSLDVTGGRYNPASNTWTPTSVTGAPSWRYGHSAVWTGTRMLIWGGSFGPGVLRTGGSYDPAANGWSPLSTTGAPSERFVHSAVWTGSTMVIWGGGRVHDNFLFSVDTGGRYDPATDSWTPTATIPAASGRLGTAVWTGSVMVVWGGDGILDTGGRYDPATDSWSATSSVGAPSSRQIHTAVWTGDVMIVWGGLHDSAEPYLDTGGRYDPLTDVWTPTSTSGAPSARRSHSAAWTGSVMVVWGGSGPGALNTGGRYDPGTDSWTPTSLAGAPSARYGQTAVWTGNRMVVWGGDGPAGWLNTGGRYDPTTDSWSPTSTTGAPTGRYMHTAVWTGNRMLIWGGYSSLANGGQYDPTADTWWPILPSVLLSGRSAHTAVWTGRLMVVWGGHNGVRHVGTGARYDPARDAWAPVSLSNAPAPRGDHSAVWTGNLMLIWGGRFHDGATQRLNSNGGGYVSADEDWDGYSVCQGDCADGDPLAYPGAAELCNGLDDDCSGLIDDDAAGVDSDGDKIRNACDNCAFDANPTQSDSDLDGEGDRCDLNDGLIYLYATDGDYREWQPESGYALWNSYRGSLAVLRTTGEYTQTPGSNSLAVRDCGLTDPWVLDGSTPGPGEVAYNLVTGVAGGLESSLGTNSAGATRENAHPCP